MGLSAPSCFLTKSSFFRKILKKHPHKKSPDVGRRDNGAPSLLWSTGRHYLACMLANESRVSHIWLHSLLRVLQPMKNNNRQEKIFAMDLCSLSSEDQTVSIFIDRLQEHTSSMASTKRGSIGSLTLASEWESCTSSGRRVCQPALLPLLGRPSQSLPAHFCIHNSAGSVHDPDPQAVCLEEFPIHRLGERLALGTFWTPDNVQTLQYLPAHHG